MDADPFALLRGPGKPWIFVQTAVLIAGSSDEMREVLAQLVGRSKPRIAMPPTPPHDVWIGMYRSHRTMVNALVMWMFNPPAISATDVIDSIPEVSRMTPEEIRPMVDLMNREEQESIIRPFIGAPFPPNDETLKHMLEDVEADDDSDTKGFEVLLESPAGQYFF